MGRPLLFPAWNLLCAERGERHGVEALAEAQHIWPCVQHHSREAAHCEIRLEPPEVSEVVLPHHPARLDFDSEQFPVLVRYDEVNLALQFVAVVVYPVVMFLGVGNGAHLMANPGLHQLARKVGVNVRLILLPVQAVGDKAGICGEELCPLAYAVVVRLVPRRDLVEYVEGAQGVDVVVCRRLAHARRRAQLLHGKQLRCPGKKPLETSRRVPDFLISVTALMPLPPRSWRQVYCLRVSAAERQPNDVLFVERTAGSHEFAVECVGQEVRPVCR